MLCLQMTFEEDCRFFRFCNSIRAAGNNINFNCNIYLLYGFVLKLYK